MDEEYCNSPQNMVPTVDPQRITYLWTKLRQAVRSYIIFKRMGADIKTFGTNNMSVYFKEEKGTTLVIHPQSLIKKLWNTFLLLIFTIYSVFVPYFICFDTDFPLWRNMKLIQDLIFLLDVFLSFTSSYWYHEHTLITNRKLIIKKYLKTWFFFDIISAIPFQLLSEKYSICVLLSLLKYFKLISSSVSFPVPAFFNLSSAAERLCKILAAIILIVQVFACSWYFFAKVQNFPVDCWIIRYNLQNYSNFYIYLSAVYWVVTTITTIGFGDITPRNNSEKIFTIIVMCFGVSLYSITIGNLITLITSIDQKKKYLNTKLDLLHNLANDISLPDPIKDKIKLTVIHNSSENLSLYNETQLISELPSNLRSEVSLYLHRAIIEKVNFFQKRDPNFLTFAVPKLKNISCSQQEYLYRIDEEAYESKK